MTAGLGINLEVTSQDWGGEWVLGESVVKGSVQSGLIVSWLSGGCSLVGLLISGWLVKLAG